MANWIKIETEKDSQIDEALTRIEGMSKAGYIGRSITDRNRSQLFVDDEGVLQFYNSVDGTITPK